MSEDCRLSVLDLRNLLEIIRLRGHWILSLLLRLAPTLRLSPMSPMAGVRCQSRSQCWTVDKNSGGVSQGKALVGNTPVLVQYTLHIYNYSIITLFYVR